MLIIKAQSRLARSHDSSARRRLGAAAACDVREPKPTVPLEITDTLEQIGDCSLSAASAADSKNNGDTVSESIFLGAHSSTTFKIC